MNVSDYYESLLSMGIAGVLTKNGREYKIHCPFHDDRHASFYVNVESGTWYCFSQGIGGSWPVLMSYLRRYGYRGPTLSQYPSPEAAKKPQGSILAWWEARGFTPEMLKHWGIGWDKRMGGSGIPIRNPEGVEYSRIWRMPEGVEPKYRYAPGFEKSAILFPPDLLVNPLPTVVLVEGPLDAIWVWEAGFAAAAILGSSISEKQFSEVCRVAQTTIVLGFDNDEAGRRVSADAAERLRAAGKIVTRIHLPLGKKDVQEVSLEELPEILQQPELAINGVGVMAHTLQRWLTAPKAGDSDSIWRYGPEDRRPWKKKRDRGF